VVVIVDQPGPVVGVVATSTTVLGGEVLLVAGVIV
jgi:hypothetical protein